MVVEGRKTKTETTSVSKKALHTTPLRPSLTQGYRGKARGERRGEGEGEEESSGAFFESRNFFLLRPDACVYT